MEKTLEPPSKAPFSFLPHRRCHLKSQTYLNLVQIVSLCYGESPLASAPPIIPLDLISGSNEESQATEKETEPRNVVFHNNTQPGELVVSDSGQCENLPSQKDRMFDESLQVADIPNRGSTCTQMVIDEIEKMMEMEENRDLLNQNDVVFPQSCEETGLEAKDLGLEQTLMNELEHIMKGNEEHGQGDSINLSATSVDENLSGNGVATVMDYQQGNINHQQIIMEESGPPGLGKVVQQDLFPRSPESIGLFSDTNLSIEVTKSHGIEDESPLAKTIEFKEGYGIQQKEMEYKKSFCSNGIVTASSHVVEDGEIEEGEISGEDGNELLPEDTLVSEQKNLDENQVHGGMDNNEELLFDKQNISNVLDSDPTFCTMNAVDNENRVRGEELIGAQNQMACEVKEVYRKKGNGTKHGFSPLLAWPNNLTLHEEILKRSGDKESITSQEKDAGACNSKRRSTSKERKQRKKLRERKKRAENNQKLGVKRLKLKPVLKPKTIKVCRHYLMGKCHEGEKCKFSHDAVPLTKSVACSHFIADRCMKGDDCPYDHELSKYPCHNFVSKGYCLRGDRCLFSHKISAPKDAPSSSNAIGTELKPLLAGNSNSEKQLSIGRTKIQRVKSSSPSVVASTHKNTKQNVAETLPVPAALATKAVSCFSVAKSPVAESSILKQGSLLPKRNETGKGENQTDKCALDTVKTVNESPKKTPSVVPRGINFLSFGKAISKDSSSKKEAALPITVGNEYKESLNEDDRTRTGKQTTQSASSKERGLNQMLKKTQPALVPTGMNFLSSGKAPVDDQGNHREASLPSSSQCAKGESSQEYQHASIKQCNLSTLSWNWPAPPLAPGQSSKLLEHKDTPNSAQKALISTAAPAAEFDNSKDRSLQESQPASDKQHNSISQNFPNLPLAVVQSSEQLMHEKTPKSAQKTLMATLAFAEKFDSEMKTNRSTNSVSCIRTEVNGETMNISVTGCSQNGSADASKFLEFLSSFSSKRNQ